MSDAWFKIVRFALVVLLVFALLAGITYAKVQQYDLGEAVMNSLQVLVVLCLGWLKDQFK